MDKCKEKTLSLSKELTLNWLKTEQEKTSKLRRDVGLQNTHIVLFKSPRDVIQIIALCQQLGLGSQMKEWCQGATSTPYGNLLIDLTPKTVDSKCAKLE